MNDGAEATIGRWRKAIDVELSRVAAGRDDLPHRLREAIHYSLTGEGKRLRGLLLMASYDALRGQGDASILAAGVEIVHAYSLVHDDLPCMDNDNMRRGRPTTHRAFDVATATAAGVTMVPLAVDQTLRAARALRLDAATTRRLVTALMQASGATGMVGGQLMDLDAEGRSLSVAELEAVHRAKTGALITAAFAMGGIAAGGGQSAVAALTAAGSALGLAFQIADDVLDATESSEALGKTAGHDAALSKSTYASVLGVVPARQRGDALVADAMARLDAAGLKTPPLERLARFVAARRS
ncbi:MAG TPA: polyprenyl synthetase family protein [Gemmatimonadaceae bacterium]